MKFCVLKYYVSKLALLLVTARIYPANICAIVCILKNTFLLNEYLQHDFIMNLIKHKKKSVCSHTKTQCYSLPSIKSHVQSRIYMEFHVKIYNHCFTSKLSIRL